MENQTKTFTVADPRGFDGDVYEVAQRSIDQIIAILEVAIDGMDTAELMLRNAQLTRNLEETPDDARAEEWHGHIHRVKLAQAAKDMDFARNTLRLLSKAAGFNPKARV